MKPAATESMELMLPQPVSGEESAADAHSEIPALISSSMRWTLWLSLVALPFSYGTNILLARIGPEALGTFGVLNVYIGLVFVFFFLGGCAVPMKFLPELDTSRRSSFLASYSLILLVCLIPWVLVATWWPQTLHFLFGDAGTPSLQLRLIYLSPICLAYLLAITSLKGLLEMKWAQILDRSVNIGQMTVLLVVLLLNKTWLTQHAADVVWLSYIGLTFVVAVLASYRLVSVGSLDGRPRFWLPVRFWPYTLLLHSNSVLSFFGSRLDYILILNFGGLVVLGQYVAITSIAGIIPRISGFVVDSLLPSLTNCLAADDLRGANRVADTYLRIMFPAILGLSLGVVVFAQPILAIMGPRYLELAGLVQIAAVGAAVQSLSQYTNVCFTATDHVRFTVFATVLRMIVFVCTFWPLWTRMGLRGAILSWVLAELVYHGISLYLLQRYLPLKMRLVTNYGGFIAALVFSLPLALGWLSGAYGAGLLLIGLAFGVFFLVARYTVAEVQRIALLLTTARMGALRR